MAGIVFSKTGNLARILESCTSEVGMSLFPEQPDLTILRHEDLLLGFQQHSSPDVTAVITFFYPGKSDVDVIGEALCDMALEPPRTNEQYRITASSRTTPTAT